MSIASTQEWKNLAQLAQKYKNFSLRDAFNTDASRFDKYNITLSSDADEILFDYSKNLIEPEVLNGLLELTKKANVEEMRSKMFGGERINFTENRAVFHVALRHQGFFNNRKNKDFFLT